MTTGEEIKNAIRGKGLTLQEAAELPPRCLLAIIGCMGWSESTGMQNLMRYAHLVDGAVKKAVDTLPEIDF